MKYLKTFRTSLKKRRPFFIVRLLTEYEVTTKFISEGITYDELYEEDKQRYEKDFTEDSNMPDFISESRIDKNVFNKNTVDMVIQSHERQKNKSM